MIGKTLRRVTVWELGRAIDYELLAQGLDPETSPQFDYHHSLQKVLQDIATAHVFGATDRDMGVYKRTTIWIQRFGTDRCVEWATYNRPSSQTISLARRVVRRHLV
jgi:hypothetical protein